MTDHDVIVALVAFDVLLVVVGYFAIGVGLLARRSVRRADLKAARRPPEGRR